VAFKTSMKPLEGSGLLGPRALQDLADVSVTTVEEFVGMASADPRSVARLIHASPSEVEQLVSRALELLEPDARMALTNQPVRKYPLGALPPREASS